MGEYLKQFKTWAYDNDNQKIKVHYKIEHYDNQQLVKVKDVPSPANPASGNIIILFELIPNGAVPNGEIPVNEYKDAYLSADWHTMPQPHKITFILVHDKGVDEETVETKDPT